MNAGKPQGLSPIIFRAPQAAGPTLFDPYTENPMQWDSASKQISFALFGKRYANFGYLTMEHL